MVLEGKTWAMRFLRNSESVPGTRLGLMQAVMAVARRRERMEEKERKTEEGNKRLEHALFKAGRRH